MIGLYNPTLFIYCLSPFFPNLQGRITRTCIWADGRLVCLTFIQDHFRMGTFIFCENKSSLVLFSGLHMNMTIRSCEMVDRLLENVCYERNGALGNQDLLNYFQNKLTFLGRVNVVSFYGRQCYCARSLCKPLINGTERTSGYVTGLILAAILTLFL